MRLASLVLLLLALPACDSAMDAEPTFGDPYQVSQAPAPAVVVTGTDARLAVTVEYSGGCEEHDFVLRSRDLGDQVEVWFVHDGRGDACDRAVTEALTAALPGVAAEAETLVLQTPAGVAVPLRSP